MTVQSNLFFYQLIHLLDKVVPPSNTDFQGTLKPETRTEAAPLKMNISVSVGDDLVFNILTFFPVKSLLRFRCVCKRWRCMISDPSFVEAHQSRSATTLLVSSFDDRRHDKKRTLYTINPSINEGELRCLSEFSNWSFSRSVNGLVCIYEQYPAKSHRVRLFNPSTREYVNLPPPIFSGRDSSKQVYNLGFDPSTKTYKILRSWIGNWSDCKYEIFTLGSDSLWRIVKDNPNIVLDTKGVCLNGTIYWTKDIGFQNSTIIMAFNVGEEKFRSVPAPPKDPMLDFKTSRMIQMGGHIAIVDYQEVAGRISNVMILWKLEDSLNGIWSHKRILLPESFMQRIPRHTSFFVTSIDGGEIALIPSELFKDRYVIYYNLEKERTRKEVLSWLFRNMWHSSPYAYCDDVSVYVESLISLKEITCVCRTFEGDNQAVGMTYSYS